MRAVHLSLLLLLCSATFACRDCFVPASQKFRDGGAITSYKPSTVPGPKGPFVEPAPDKTPSTIHCVVAGRAQTLTEAEALLVRVRSVQEVPAGYPAVDEAAFYLPDSNSKMVVLAGKFVLPAYAQKLQTILAEAGLEESMVVERPYQHDRQSPMLRRSEGTKLGMIFSGVVGVDVPLLAGAGRDAPGANQLLADGTLVWVTGQVEVDHESWLRVERDGLAGFLPLNRVLVEYNAFPSPSGNRAVLGIPLGCNQDACRWDYWLVGRGLKPRQLLLTAAKGLSYVFSPHAELLAYASAEGRMILVPEAPATATNLGFGLSPWFSTSGPRLYFRRPAKGEFRDEVVSAAPPDWRTETVLEVPGELDYPILTDSPPPALEAHGQNMIATFFRIESADGRQERRRIRILFSADKKILDQRNEPLGE